MVNSVYNLMRFQIILNTRGAVEQLDLADFQPRLRVVVVRPLLDHLEEI